MDETTAGQAPAAPLWARLSHAAATRMAPLPATDPTPGELLQGHAQASVRFLPSGAAGSPPPVFGRPDGEAPEHEDEHVAHAERPRDVTDIRLPGVRARPQQ